MVKALRIFKEKLISVFNPPYQLVLDKKSENYSLDSVYVFKQYGSHDFMKISYQDICNNLGIMRSINPDDLRQIHIHEYQRSLDKNVYQITETLRNNEYVLTSNGRSERHSGKFLARNLDMFTNIQPQDLWTIAHAEGFELGKKILNDLRNNKFVNVAPELKKISKEVNHANVVNFHDFKT